MRAPACRRSSASLPSPPDADVALADAGYAMADRSLVMIADPGRTAATPAVELAAHPDSAWLEGQANANAIVPALRPAHAAIVGALRAPAAFATLRDGDEPIGFGLAVAERGLVGLFDLVVVPSRRGEGHGRALCEALLAWGRDCGARGAYLQVREDNRVALALYGSLGFRHAYAYHYRIAPAGEIA